MRACLGVVAMLAGCDVVFDLDDPPAELVTVRIAQDRAFVHDTPTDKDVVELVPFSSGEVIAEARSGTSDTPVATRYEDGAVVFEVPRGTRYRAHVGENEVQGIAGTDDLQTLPDHVAGSPEVELPSGMPWVEVFSVPPYPVPYNTVMVTTGLWQVTALQGHPAENTNVRFTLDRAQRISASQPVALPRAAQGDRNFMLRKLDDPERVVDGWKLPSFGPGQSTVDYNNLERTAVDRCAMVDVDVSAVLRRFDAIAPEADAITTSYLEILATPRPTYVAEGFTLVHVPLPSTEPAFGLEVPYVDPLDRLRVANLVAYRTQPGIDGISGVNVTVAADAMAPTCDALRYERTSFAVPSQPTLDGASLATDTTIELGDRPLVAIDWAPASGGPHDVYLLTLFDRTASAQVVRRWYSTATHVDISSALLLTNHRYELVLASLSGVPGASTRDFATKQLPLTRAFVSTGRFAISR